MATGAQASSFVVLEPIAEEVGPSMIVLGAPAQTAVAPNVAEAANTQPADIVVPLAFPLPGEAAGDDPLVLMAPAPSGVYAVPLPRTISPSIIALGEPAVSGEKLAAVNVDAERKPARQPALTPMVIRGGLIGDPFAARASAAPVVPVKAEAQVPAAGNSSPYRAPVRRETPPDSEPLTYRPE